MTVKTVQNNDAIGLRGVTSNFNNSGLEAISNNRNPEKASVTVDTELVTRDPETLTKEQSELFMERTAALRKSDIPDRVPDSKEPDVTIKELGSGGQGIVKKITHGDQTYIEKTPTMVSNNDLIGPFMEQRKLVEIARENVQKEGNYLIDQQGLDSCVFTEKMIAKFPDGKQMPFEEFRKYAEDTKQQEEEGNGKSPSGEARRLSPDELREFAKEKEITLGFLQGFVDGRNGKDAIYTTPIEFFSNGCVQNPQHSTKMLSGLLLGLHLIHKAGYVQSDIKLPNIMFCGPESEPNMWIVDMDLISKEGRTLTDMFGSSNGAPELKAALLDAFENDKDLQYVLSNKYDIFSAGTLFPQFLFGQLSDTEFITKDQYNRSRSVFESNVFTIEESEYAKHVKEFSDEQVSDFFRGKFNKLNDEMFKKTGKKYPPDVLNALSDLTARMCSLDPNKRPTAIECYEILMHLGLSDWNSNSFTIDGMKVPDALKNLQKQPENDSIPAPSTPAVSIPAPSK
ncbi:MAG: hypothetical protein LBB18_00245, partial [Puniceicoccales bacterium]|nr:hypothetical protein [Puniceicoccales bacterium]